MKLGAQGGFFFDWVEPAPIRHKNEQARIDREDARRRRGDYNMRMVKNAQGVVTRTPIEDTEAWAIYQQQLAAGMDEEPPLPPKMHENSVQDRREAKGMTQTDLARRAGVSRRTLQRIEEGGVCRWKTQRKILHGLGVPWEERAEVFDPAGGSGE